MKQNQRKRAAKAAAVSTAMLIGLAAGSALAVPHDDIILKDYDGSLIVPVDGKAPAYSVKTTCFGTVGCHGDANAANPTVRLGYNDIERHSYHAVNGTNEVRGFNSWNPDGMLPDGVTVDPFQRGVGTQNKNWVQSPGHVGNW